MDFCKLFFGGKIFDVFLLFFFENKYKARRLKKVDPKKMSNFIICTVGPKLGVGRKMKKT